ncbi:kallikrein-8 isoform X1 [Monodelphis domestica]|uniref:kallikrein-8 isoform X1 n=2 Tax=Monodelphis domestica TaxID=13616 RepID=UPI0024E27245|nr:kallikrein-8 isoform X1 [Monodelphis domestica]XP_056652923.1 kallikrein-8 isoform X1 [Monodelphis domestica]
MGPSSGSWSSCFHAWKRWAFLQLLLTTCAGSLWVQDSRVLEGQPCEPHSQPWQAGLFQGVRLLCGGVLVAPQWVLTAAHCQKPNYSVRLGENSLEKREDSEQEIEVAQSIPHPCYNSSNNKHDLMLLRLRKPAEVNRNVQPIGLASRCPQPNQECTVSGWGTTTSPRENFPDTLHCAQLYIWSQDRCEKAYPDKISDGMVCAGNNNGADTCQGDSGGPLVCGGALQGITSWGADPCGAVDKPGVYTSVCRYTAWIKKIMDAN